MPQFNTPGTLQVTYPTGNFGSTDFSYNTLTLLDSTPAASQVQVRYEPITYMPTPSGPGINIDSEVSGLSSAQLEAFQNLSGPDVVFVGVGSEIVFNEIDKTVQVPTPEYVTVDPYVYNGTTYTKLYYDTTVSAPDISASEPLVLRRSTNVTQATTTFQPGSRLTSEMLNNARNQNLYAIQELTEFGALAGEGGTGGGGEFDGNLWDISGAQQLNSAPDGNVIWSGENLVSTLDAQGVMPYTTGITASGYVLLSDLAASNVTKTTWTPLNADVVDAGGVPLSNVLVALNAKAAYFEDTADGLLVNGGDEGKVEVESTDILLDGLVTIEGDLVAPLINGAIPLNEDSALSDLGDVTAPAPSLDDSLMWDGSEWAPGKPEIAGTKAAIALPYARIVQNAAPSTPIFISPGNDIEPTITNFPNLFYQGDTEMVDGFDGSTGKWTAPEAGRYEINCEVQWMGQDSQELARASLAVISGSISSTDYDYRVLHGTSEVIQIENHVIMDLQAGAEVTFMMQNNVTGTADVYWRYFDTTIKRIDFTANLTGLPVPAYVTLTPNAYQTDDGGTASVDIASTSGDTSADVNMFQYINNGNRFSNMDSLVNMCPVGNVAYNSGGGFSSIIDCMDNAGANFFSLATSSNGVAIFKRPGLYRVDLSGIFSTNSGSSYGASGGFRVKRNGVGGLFGQNAISSLPASGSGTEYISNSFLIPVTQADVDNESQYAFYITNNRSTEAGTSKMNASRIQMTLALVGEI